MLKVISGILTLFSLSLSNADQAANGNQDAQGNAVKVQKLGFRPGDKIVEVNGQQVSNPKQAMELYNEMKTRDTATAVRTDHTENATCVPNIMPQTGGQVDGFRCFNMKPEDALTKAGVLNGDVIKSVDGEEITSPVEFNKLVLKVQARDYNEIQIVRNGQEQTLRATQ
jgi:type II secretory pathway component PulC